MIGPLCGGSQARWSDDVEENGVIDISVLANISRDRSRTCGSRIHSGLREKCEGKEGWRLGVENGGRSGPENGETSRAKNSIRLYTNFSTGPLTATLFSSTSSSIPLGYVSGEIEAFIGFLHKCHEHRTNSKDENFLFSPAIFDPDRSPGTNRGKANIAYLRHVVMDFEDGELRPEELPNLFPGLRMVVTNTFSHSSDNPRFRAV
jgi:hypothetical protein